MNIESQNLEKIQLQCTDTYNKGTFRRMLQSSPTMKREIQNASYRPFIDNESISLTMSVSTYFECVASLLMKWEAYVGTYL